MTDLSDRARVLGEAVDDIQRQLSAAIASAQQWERAALKATAELEALQPILARAQHERDFYMRFCAEIVAQASGVEMTVKAMLDAAKMASYRPNGAIAEQARTAIAAMDTDPIPEFLTDRLGQ